MKKMVSTGLILLAIGRGHTMAETAPEPLPPQSPTPAETQKGAPPKEKPKKDLTDNLFYGGYFNFSFGNYQLIGIEPMIGYRLNNKLSGGATVRYEYIRDDRYTTTRKSMTYGGSVFGRYRLTPKLYAQVEPALYNYKQYGSNSSTSREWVPYIFGGGGFSQPLGGRASLYAEVMFDFLQDDQSPYKSWEPFFSVGLGIGL